MLDSDMHLHVETFFSTPELVIFLCGVLDDADLLVVSQVSRRFNTIALHMFFTHHGMTVADIACGIFSLSSLSLLAFRFALFIPPIKKLSCAFDPTTIDLDVSSLYHVLPRLPPIPEIIITTATDWHVTPREYNLDIHCVSRLLHTLHPYNNFLVLYNNEFLVSKHRRVVIPHQVSIKDPGLPLCALVAYLPVICSLLLVNSFLQLAATTSSVVSDPHAHTLQNRRIYFDMVTHHHYPQPDAMRIVSPMLTSPSCAKWTMVTINESVTTTLNVKRMSFLNDEKWHLVLSALRLPALKTLIVEHGVKISFSTLAAFINRHPTIQALVLGHHAIPYSSYCSKHAALPLSPNCLDNLTTLHASSRFIDLLLQSTPLPNLDMINIGPEIAMRFSSFVCGRFPDRGAKIETPFDFTTLDKVLTTIMGCEYLARGITKFGVTIPGWSWAKKWLAKHKLDSTSSTGGMLRVKHVVISTECGIPFHRSAISLLADWILRVFLTSDLEKVTLLSSMHSSDKAVFESKIKAVAGDVTVKFLLGYSEYSHILH